MKYIRYSLTILVLLLPFTGSVFGEDAPGTESGRHEQAAAKEKRVVAAVDADGVQRVALTGGEYFFDPNHIVVKVNVPVELMARKEKGFVPHNIVVKAPEAGIDFTVKLDADKPETIRFTPTKTGVYPMLCDKKLLFFKSHRERGMEGVIEVVE